MIARACTGMSVDPARAGNGVPQGRRQLLERDIGWGCLGFGSRRLFIVVQGRPAQSGERSGRRDRYVIVLPFYTWCAPCFRVQYERAHAGV